VAAAIVGVARKIHGLTPQTLVCIPKPDVLEKLEKVLGNDTAALMKLELTISQFKQILR